MGHLETGYGLRMVTMQWVTWGHICKLRMVTMQWVTWGQSCKLRMVTM